MGKALHVVFIAQRSLHAGPFRQHVFRLDAVLCENGAVALGALGHVGPDHVEPLHAGQVVEVEALLQLLAAHARAQYRLHQRLGERVVVVGQRHRHAEFVADLLGLAQDDLQHHGVDRVVGAVHQGGAHHAALLTEAVDTAFTLLVAGGVPAQVVVHHRAEERLQVDALGHAVGGNQQGAAGLAKGLHAGLALFWRQLAGDDADGDAGEAVFQMAVQVVGGGDVAAEDHRREAATQQLGFQVLAQGGELGVAAFAGQLLGLGDEAG